MINRICVGFDGSGNSYRAFDFATDLLKQCSNGGPDIIVLSVVVPPEIANVEADVNVAGLMDTLAAQYAALHERLNERAQEKGLKIQTEVVEGHAAEEILRYIRERTCDMIVLGQKGKSEIDEILLGSVARRVSHRAPCSVTLVP
jgi:nucleotide-binding universal stress UspA family protein